MNHLIPFLHANWMLATAVVVVLLALLLVELKHRLTAAVSVSAQDSVLKVNQKNAQIIDVRSTEDFKKGHIVDAQSHPNASVKDLVERLKKHQEHPILVVCASGNQSKLMAVGLKKHGFTSVHAIEGGINTWKKASLPTIKES